MEIKKEGKKDVKKEEKKERKRLIAHSASAHTNQEGP